MCLCCRIHSPGYPDICLLRGDVLWRAGEGGVHEDRANEGVDSRVGADERAHRNMLVYEPGHPDADSDGMVAVPDINMANEMVDLIAASRTFDANLAVMKNARSMAIQTLSIGKRS